MKSEAQREQEILTEIRRVLARHAPELEGYQVVLFGSRASGRSRPRSDFDLGVLGRQGLPPKTFHQIGEELEQIETLYRLDWVDLTQASEGFRQQATQTMKVLYGR